MSGLDRALDGSPTSNDLNTLPRMTSLHRRSFWPRNRDMDDVERNGQCRTKCVVIGLILFFLLVVSVSIAVILLQNISKNSEAEKVNEHSSNATGMNDVLPDDILLKLNGLDDILSNKTASDTLLHKSQSNRRFHLFFNAIIDNEDALGLLTRENFTVDDLKEMLTKIEEQLSGDNTFNGKNTVLDDDGDLIVRLLDSVQGSLEKSNISPSSSALTRKVDEDGASIKYVVLQDNHFLEAVNKTVVEMHHNKEFMEKINILYDNLKLVDDRTQVSEVENILDDFEWLEDMNNVFNTSTNKSKQAGSTNWLTSYKNDRRFRMFLSIILKNDEVLRYLHQSNITTQELGDAIKSYLQPQDGSPSMREAPSTEINKELAPVVALLVESVKVLNKEGLIRMNVDDIFATPLDVDEDHYLSAISDTVEGVYMNEGFMLKVKFLYENLDEMGNRTLQHIEHDALDRAGQSDVVEYDKDLTPMKEKADVLIKDFKWLLHMQSQMKEMLDSMKQKDLNKTINLGKLLDTQSIDNLFDLYLKKANQFGFKQITAQLQEIGFHAMPAKNEATDDTNVQPPLDPYIKKQMKLQAIREKIATSGESNVEPRMGNEDQDSQGNQNLVICNPSIELACNDNRGCYLRHQKCDRFVECTDNSDEWNCTCLDYLSQSKRCDGYEDCPYGEDEANCHCPNGMLYCGEFDESGQTPICISEDLRCDNVYDCDNGMDEKYCYELRPKGPTDSKLYSNPSNSGILYSKMGKKWQMISIQLAPPRQNDYDYGFVQEELGTYLQQIARDVCRDTMVFGASEPEFELQSLEPATSPTTIAHLRLNFDQNEEVITENEAYHGRYTYEILPPREDSKVMLVTCGEPKCGTKNDDRVSFFKSKHVDMKENCKGCRIVGGAESVFGDWPYIVSLTRNGKFVCGATIIDDSWIVTAAHCVQGYRSDEHFFQVIVGMYRKDSRSSHQYPRTLEKIFINPQYNATWLSADIALAKVDKPFKFSYAVSPVCLPDDFVCDYPKSKNKSELQGPRRDAYCISAGWGNVKEGGPPSDELREFKVPILESCAKSYNDINTQVCGGYEEGGKDSCQGDSGGPLFCKHPDEKGTWYLGGVISHGQGCARPNTPGVYTRVCSYKQWIRDTIEEAERSKRSVDNEPPATISDDAPIITPPEMKEEFDNPPLTRMDKIGDKRRMDVDYDFYDPSSDTLHRANTKCPTLTCDGGVCIEASKVCDSFADCHDGSDELGCFFDSSKNKKEFDPQRLKEVLLNMEQTKPVITETALAIPETPKQGSIFTIIDAHKTCHSGEFRCRKMFQCVPQDNVCDMKVDCKDHTDEKGCKCHNFLANLDSGKICDGHPDCDDWADEVGCNYCQELQTELKNVPMFYCDLSRQCIPRDKMCDTVHDCDLREDERYCLNIASGDTVVYKEDGRPIHHSEGLVAINTQGHWRAVSVPGWAERMNDQICRYMGFRESLSFELIEKETYPHLTQGDLQVQFNYPGTIRMRLRRELNDRNVTLPDKYSDSSSLFSIRDIRKDLHNREKRQEISSSFVQSKCHPSPTCGIMHLYSFMGIKSTPHFGSGTFPWHVNLYKDGSYVCGGTLVHQEWVLLGHGCALKINPPRDWVVARMGGYRDLEFKSAHEQYRRLVEITEIPGTRIYLGSLENPVEMTEYVNLICIPDQRWIPVGTECVITGRHDGNLKHPYETILAGKCNEVSNSTFDLCTRQNVNTGECFDNWSGVLACPDGTEKYYAVGVYHTDGCETQHPPPTVFKPLITRAIREAIRSIINTVQDAEVISSVKLRDVVCNARNGKYRCPLGKCLNEHQRCDGIIDCLDGSDEDAEYCSGREKMRMCIPLNQTHCECSSATDMRCQNMVCVDKSKFCNNVDDCGDGSDEPKNCNACSVMLKIKEPSKICDAKIDCVDTGNDMAGDEASELCCPKDDYSFEQYGSKRVRCVLGELTSNIRNNQNRVSIRRLQCVPYQSICDGDDGTPTCVNGADETDCLNIWPSLKHSTSISTADISKMPEDAFGRYRSKAMGYLYFTLHGKSHLYCADQTLFGDEERNKLIGRSICKSENHADMDTIALHSPSRPPQRPNENEELSAKEKLAYENCVLVYLVCKP